MKAKREHRVPLGRRAVDILGVARTLGGGDSSLVFPGPRGKPLSHTPLYTVLKEHGIAAVPHGFRSSFRDWAAEKTDHPREVIEAALAHVVQNQVEAAYARSDLFERRRALMNDWEAYLAGTPSASPDRGTSGTRTRRNRSTPDELDPTPPPVVDQTARQRVSQAEITDGDRVQVRTERGKDIERDGGHEQIPENDEGEPGGEEQEMGGTHRGNGNWLLTSKSGASVFPAARSCP